MRQIILLLLLLALPLTSGCTSQYRYKPAAGMTKSEVLRTDTLCRYRARGDYGTVDRQGFEVCMNSHNIDIVWEE